MPHARSTCTRLAAAMVLLSLTSCPGLGSLMRLYGYTELRPPSTLLAPGALVAVISRHPFTAAIVCGPRASLGAYWKPQQSVTASAELRKVNGKHFVMEAEFIDQIKADARFKYISSITVTLNNARIVELQDTDVVGGMRNRSVDCARAVEARLGHGFDITMISSGLSGDVRYSVKWDSSVSLDAKAKVEALSELAVELGGGATCTTETEIKAVGLMWGIRDDKFLAALSIPELDERLVAPGTKMMGAEHTAKILPIPDAPVIPQPGYGDPYSADVYVCEDCDLDEMDDLVPIGDKPEGNPIYDATRKPSERRERKERTKEPRPRPQSTMW